MSLVLILMKKMSKLIGKMCSTKIYAVRTPNTFKYILIELR